MLVKATCGQNNHALQVVCNDKPTTFFQKKFSYQTHNKDSLKANLEARDLLNKLKSNGYVGASIDSIRGDTAHTTIYMYVGEKVGSMILKNGNVDEKLLGDAGVKATVLSGKPIKIGEALNVKQKLLRQCENTGFPFASTRIDSFEQSDAYFKAKLFLEKFDEIRYDTLHILGKTKVKKIFLKSYLGIKPGKVYNETTIRKIAQRISALQFVEPIQPFTVEFISGKAKVNLFLKDKKASQFDLLIGFLPGSSGQKLLITGEGTLHLFSMFGVGEEIYLKWSKLQPKTQTLDVRLTYPYLLGLPLGINASFNLYKRDTSYVDINGDYGIQYQLAGSDYLRASLKQKITILTNVDTSYIILNRKLPPNIDLTSNEFSLEYYVQKLDYRFNPTSGFALTANGSAGVRQIKRNNNILGLYDGVSQRYFSYLYDTISLKSFEFKLGLAIDKFWRLAARHTIRTYFEGKYFYSKTIFDNEKFRLGGINSLRGFDDQSIFTPYYGMADVEYRFLISKNSYFSAFFNAALVQNAPTRKGMFDYPFGFGVTAAVETKAGIFGITYAMGKQLDNKITFKSAKIHFGYINYF